MQKLGEGSATIAVLAVSKFWSLESGNGMEQRTPAHRELVPISRTETGSAFVPPEVSRLARMKLTTRVMLDVAELPQILMFRM